MLSPLRPLIFVFLVLTGLPVVVSVGTPSANLCSNSFASTLWNATYAAKQELYRLKEKHIKNLQQYRQDRLNRTFCPHNATTMHSADKNEGVTSKPNPPAADDTNAAKDETAVLLTEYLGRLEQRLNTIEQNQQMFSNLTATQMNQVIQNQKPLLVFEGLRLFFVAALPLLFWSVTLAVVMVLLTHLMGFALQWAQPFADKALQKINLAIMVVAQFIVDILEQKPSPASGQTPDIAL